MNHQSVGDQQRMFFEAYGYLVLPGLFADDVDGLRAAFDEVFADQANPRLDYNVVGHRWHSEFLMANFIERHPRLDALRTDPRLTGVVAALLGPTATYTNSDASIYCCESEWHYDTPTAVPDRRHVKALLYLEPIDASTGALRVLPSSHHDAGLYGSTLAPYLGFDGGIGDRTGILGEHLPHWVVPSAPGDVLVLDFRIMHASYGSTEPRRKIAVNFNGEFHGDPARLRPPQRPDV